MNLDDLLKNAAPLPWSIMEPLENQYERGRTIMAAGGITMVAQFVELKDAELIVAIGQLVEHLKHREELVSRAEQVIRDCRQHLSPYAKTVPVRVRSDDLMRDIENLLIDLARAQQP